MCAMELRCEPCAVRNHRAQGLFIVMTYAVTLLGDFYQRLLFLKFTTLSSVIIAVVQRSALSLLTGPVLMSHWCVCAYAAAARQPPVCAHADGHYPVVSLLLPQVLQPTQSHQVVGVQASVQQGGESSHPQQFQGVSLRPRLHALLRPHRQLYVAGGLAGGHAVDAPRLQRWRVPFEQ